MEATLTDMPHEILSEIFHNLSSIDDVHHLGRACKMIYTVIKRQKDYVDIMRSIIWRSPRHRYDRQLSRMLELRRDIVRWMRQGQNQLPVTRTVHEGTEINIWEHALLRSITAKDEDTDGCPLELNDDMVYEILARYQGLRLFENLWLKRQINENDLFAADNHNTARQMSKAYRSLAVHIRKVRNGDIPKRKADTPETTDYTILDSHQRARFYSAIIYVWLMNEIRWVLANFAYPSPFHTPINILQTCKYSLAKQKHEPLLDELDQYAVFKFLYHYLLPTCASPLANQSSSALPFTFLPVLGNEPFNGRLLQLFLLSSQTYLQPPDLIDILVRTATSSRHPYPTFTIPHSTQIFQRPSRVYPFPEAQNLLNPNTSMALHITRIALSHLNIISRSSAHQTPTDVSPALTAVEMDQLFDVRDHAGWWFAERALVAFELGQDPRERVKVDVRSVFGEEWGRIFWSVWWWAGSAEKARAKMERWRESRRGCI